METRNLITYLIIFFALSVIAFTCPWGEMLGDLTGPVKGFFDAIIDFFSNLVG